MAGTTNRAFPVFVLAKNLAEESTGYAICSAAERVAGSGSMVGAQRIGGLWRLYPSSAEARATLLASGITMGGCKVFLLGENPFIVRGGDGREIPATRLVIGDLPISISQDSILRALANLGVVTRSKVIEERMRDPSGRLTT